LRNFITENKKLNLKLNLRLAAFVCSFILLHSFNSFAQQKLAVLTPDKTTESINFAENLETSLSSKFKITNSSLSESAFLSSNPEKPFNLTTQEAKIIGAAIGCNYFVLVKSQNLRRYSSEKKEYFESYAAVYVVSSRTGRLVFWKLKSFDGNQSSDAEKLLLNSTDNLAAEIFDKLQIISQAELSEKVVELEEIPDENSPDAKNFRAPLPYKKLSPQYTTLANLYGIAATVDIEIDFDEGGKILRTEIVRWAGFGLDEAVTETICKMNWRPATRNGKALPIRVLLRYNFKKLDKE
jgi:Gram-negative bacterial TonB protein C-terminal